MKTPRPSPACRAVTCWLFALLLTSGLPGCVQRRLTIRSNPPGALVYIDNHEIGVTPVSTDYIYYGTRKFRLVKDGYETLTVEQRMPPPWYQVPPLDFVSENLVPAEIRDERTIDFQLLPQRIVATQPLLGRAENLRQAGQAPGAVPVVIPQPGFGPLPAESVPPGTWPLPAPRNRY